MAKATHYGTCQACGREQKLPGGVLSNHGYTVRWNMFNGVCPGAGALPFEISKDLIEHFIKNAERTRDDFQKQIKAVSDSTGTSEVPFHKYVTGRGGGYRVWVNVQIKDGQIIFEDGTTAPARRFAGLGLGSDNQIADSLRKKKIAWIERQIKGVEEYISWQNERLAGWEPKPLKEV
jgi:hypothetical protein